MEIRGKYIICRTVKSKKITGDTTMTSLCTRLGFDREKFRHKKFPFTFDHEGETYHFQRLDSLAQIREMGMDKDDFRNLRKA